MMRALLPLAALLAVSACASHQLAECANPKVTTVLNGPSLEPSVWDDGASTFLRFPGNSRIPTVFVLNPDGKEAVASYTVDPSSNLVTVHQTAAELRLRDGDSVMCIHNAAYEPTGYKTGTDTTNPDVERVLKGTGS